MCFFIFAKTNTVNSKKALPYIFLIGLAIVVLLIRNCSSHSSDKNTTTTIKEQRGLNRNPSQINYSKHAKCRMDCRHIDETEVKDILKNGTVNYRKSELDAGNCKKRYAVEGYSKDNQHLRVVFAPCESEVTVVTCIDLDTEWECHCEGDENKN